MYSVLDTGMVTALDRLYFSLNVLSIGLPQCFPQARGVARQAHLGWGDSTTAAVVQYRIKLLTSTGFKLPFKRHFLSFLQYRCDRRMTPVFNMGFATQKAAVDYSIVNTLI